MSRLERVRLNRDLRYKMTASLWSIWNTVAQPAVARLKPGECALLIILAASLLRRRGIPRTLCSQFATAGVDAA